MAAAKAAGLKRRYATITIRENAFRRAHVEGVPYKKGSAKKKKVKKELVEEEEEPAEYVVEKLVDTRRASGTREYHVELSLQCCVLRWTSLVVLGTFPPV